MGNLNTHTLFNRLQDQLEKEALHTTDPEVSDIASQVDALHHDYANATPPNSMVNPTIIDEGEPTDAHEPLTLLHLMDMDGGPLSRTITLTYDPDQGTISIHRHDPCE